jgi:hypothetical protein
VLGGMMALRASEMAGLTVDYLTSVRGYTTLTFIGKGDKPARVPLHLLRHSRPETTVASYDVSGDALERHASQIAGFLAGWAG